MQEQKDKNLIDKKMKQNTKYGFVKVKCHNCGEEQVIFSKVSTIVKCKKCSKTIALPTGGKASIKAEILELI